MLEFHLRKQLDGFELKVDLSAPPESIVVLFGPSGAGKSMTLGAVAGFLPLDAGRIVVGARVLLDSEKGINLAPQQRRIGLVRQDLSLFPHLTVEQNIAFGLFRERPNTARARTQDLLRLVHLDGLGARHPAELSGGQQQRVALARALAPRPDLLLLDEPFSALDAPTRVALRHELCELQSEFKIPMVFVTHDLGEAYFLADQLTVMDAGEIVQSGTPGDILRRPQNLTVARATGVKNILPGVISACDRQATLVRVGDAIVQAPSYPFDAGDRVHLCLRPERIMLLRPERAGRSSDENALQGRLIHETSDGTNVTLYFRSEDMRLAPGQDYDLQIELPVYIYERLNLAVQREWTVSLRKNAIHLIR